MGFDYLTPIEITETVVENSTLKSFSDVKDTFEKMVCVVNADEKTSSVITVDNVRLSYSRISEKDSFDTGLIVPVWSFEGKRDIYYEEGKANRNNMKSPSDFDLFVDYYSREISTLTGSDPEETEGQT